MTKEKVRRAEATAPMLQRIQSKNIELPSVTLEANPQAQFLPRCTFCQHKIEFLNEATMLLSGQWIPNTELNEPVFLLEVDTPMKFVQLSNGQYALVSEDSEKTVQIVRHAHDECLERLRLEVTGFLEYEPFG
jgi:hypothetical protein